MMQNGTSTCGGAVVSSQRSSSTNGVSSSSTDGTSDQRISDVTKRRAPAEEAVNGNVNDDVDEGDDDVDQEQEEEGATATTARPTTELFSIDNLPNTRQLQFFKNSPLTVIPAPPPKIKVGAFIVKEEELNDNDVLSGRGNRVNYHEGNKRFRFLINEHKPEYLHPDRTKTEKAIICARVVERIRSLDPPGRFLQKGLLKDEPPDLWIDVGDERARRKVGQALREHGNAPNQRSSSTSTESASASNLPPASVTLPAVKSSATSSSSTTTTPTPAIADACSSKSSLLNAATVSAGNTAAESNAASKSTTASSTTTHKDDSRANVVSTVGIDHIKRGVPRRSSFKKKKTTKNNNQNSSSSSDDSHHKNVTIDLGGSSCSKNHEKRNEIPKSIEVSCSNAGDFLFNNHENKMKMISDSSAVTGVKQPPHSFIDERNSKAIVEDVKMAADHQIQAMSSSSLQFVVQQQQQHHRRASTSILKYQQQQEQQEQLRRSSGAVTVSTCSNTLYSSGGGSGGFDDSTRRSSVYSNRSNYTTLTSASASASASATNSNAQKLVDHRTLSLRSLYSRTSSSSLVARTDGMTIDSSGNMPPPPNISKHCNNAASASASVRTAPPTTSTNNVIDLSQVEEHEQQQRSNQQQVIAPPSPPPTSLIRNEVSELSIMAEGDSMMNLSLNMSMDFTTNDGSDEEGDDALLYEPDPIPEHTGANHIRSATSHYPSSLTFETTDMGGHHRHRHSSASALLRMSQISDLTQSDHMALLSQYLQSSQMQQSQMMYQQSYNHLAHQSMQFGNGSSAIDGGGGGGGASTVVSAPSRLVIHNNEQIPSPPPPPSRHPRMMRGIAELEPQCSLGSVVGPMHHDSIDAANELTKSLENEWANEKEEKVPASSSEDEDNDDDEDVSVSEESDDDDDDNPSTANDDNNDRNINKTETDLEALKAKKKLLMSQRTRSTGSSSTLPTSNSFGQSQSSLLTPVISNAVDGKPGGRKRVVPNPSLLAGDVTAVSKGKISEEAGSFAGGIDPPPLTRQQHTQETYPTQQHREGDHNHDEEVWTSPNIKSFFQRQQDQHRHEAGNEHHHPQDGREEETTMVNTTTTVPLKAQSSDEISAMKHNEGGVGASVVGSLEREDSEQTKSTLAREMSSSDNLSHALLSSVHSGMFTATSSSGGSSWQHGATSSSRYSRNTSENTQTSGLSGFSSLARFSSDKTIESIPSCSRLLLQSIINGAKEEEEAGVDNHKECKRQLPFETSQNSSSSDSNGGSPLALGESVIKNEGEIEVENLLEEMQAVQRSARELKRSPSKRSHKQSSKGSLMSRQGSGVSVGTSNTNQRMPSRRRMYSQQRRRSSTATTNSSNMSITNSLTSVYTKEIAVTSPPMNQGHASSNHTTPNSTDNNTVQNHNNNNNRNCSPSRRESISLSALIQLTAQQKQQLAQAARRKSSRSYASAATGKQRRNSSISMDDLTLSFASIMTDDNPLTSQEWSNIAAAADAEDAAVASFSDFSFGQLEQTNSDSVEVDFDPNHQQRAIYGVNPLLLEQSCNSSMHFSTVDEMPDEDDAQTSAGSIGLLSRSNRAAEDASINDMELSQRSMMSGI